MTIPRLLVLMGSGETSPTMVKTHREVLGRLGPPPVPAVLLDTPFGFQGNAEDLTRRAQSYFRDSVGHDLEVARFRSASEVGTVAYEAMLARLRSARFVFAGPGSPTYALRQWRSSLVPQILRGKLQTGGCVTFASAAALTLGLVTVPVYEIYKVGKEPSWEEGLDLLSELELPVAVIPHYNNAEGGTHDTRFCYLGQDRLERMERELPDDAFVLGVDEHTGLVIDVGQRSATVVGLGKVTVRSHGRSAVLEAGTVTAVEALLATAGRLRDGRAAGAAAAASPDPADGATPGVAGGAGTAPATPLLDSLSALGSDFDRALEVADVAAVVQVVLDLEAELHAWSSETFDSDQYDRARAVIRSMVVRLGGLASGVSGRRDVVEPFVEAMLALRSEARAGRRYADADAVRDRLVELGVEVRDSPAGTEWDLPNTTSPKAGETPSS